MIPAKQKAEELVKNIQFTQIGYVMPFIVAKQCALICVEEMINENASILKMAELHMDLRSILVIKNRILDLRHIKTEIENL